MTRNGCSTVIDRLLLLLGQRAMMMHEDIYSPKEHSDRFLKPETYLHFGLASDWSTDR